MTDKKQYKNFAAIPLFHTGVPFRKNGLPVTADNLDQYFSFFQKLKEGGIFRFKSVDNHEKVFGWLEILTPEEAATERATYAPKGNAMTAQPPAVGL